MFIVLEMSEKSDADNAREGFLDHPEAEEWTIHGWYYVFTGHFAGGLQLPS